MGYIAHVRQRPIKTAVIVNADPAFAHHTDLLLDAMVLSSLGLWGGRLNPIVAIDPKANPTEQQWQLLEVADPDCVIAFTSLENSQIEKLDQRLQPWLIENEKEVHFPEGKSTQAIWNQFPLQLPGIEIAPTLSNVRSFGNLKLLLFEFGSSCPIEYRRFFHRNFGTYYQWQDGKGDVRRLAGLENLIKQIEVMTIKIDDLSSACSAIELMAGNFFPPNLRSPITFTAPCQLSGLGLGFDWPSFHFSNNFTVFVGKDVLDFTSYWNESWLCSCWRTPFKHSLWISDELLNVPEFKEAVKALLWTSSGQHSSGARNVIFTSDSLPKADLERITDDMRNGKRRLPASTIDQADRLGRFLNDVTTIRIDRPRIVLNSSNSERFRFENPSEKLILPEPAFITGDGSWAADVQIESNMTFPGSQHWWCLPKKAGSRLAPYLFFGPARVNREFLASVEVTKCNDTARGSIRPEIQLRLLNESSIALQLLLADRKGLQQTDARMARSETLNEPIKDYKISDKGENLKGLISLFRNFWTAASFLERCFWRTVFLKLSGRNETRELGIQTELTNVARKALPGLGVESSTLEKGAELIARRVMKRIHHRLKLSDKPLSMSELEALLLEINCSPTEKVYVSGNTVVDASHLPALSTNDVHEGIDQLLKFNILRTGIELRCRNCGIKTWFHIDQVNQINECVGCGAKDSISGTAEWKFRLNTLAQHCVSQNVFSVLQALSQLANHATSAFFYAPSIELSLAGLEDSREVDFICAIDGKLVIGEVKDGNFKESDFSKLQEVLGVIKPDCAAIFVKHTEFEKASKWFSQFRDHLARSKIAAELHALPSI